MVSPAGETAMTPAPSAYRRLRPGSAVATGRATSTVSSNDAASPPCACAEALMPKAIREITVSAIATHDTMIAS